jgi:type IV pilus assembly protein PilA
MIVIVIIAVLASIAIPGFQTQVARSHVMGGMSEVRALTTAYEDLALRGITTFELQDLGVSLDDNSTQRCSLSMELPDAESGDGALICSLIGAPQIQSHRLRLQRSGPQGRWSCLTDLPVAFIPDGCQSDGD